MTKKMEEEIKTMQKHMAGMARTKLDLKARVETLQKGAKDQLDRQNLCSGTLGKEPNHLLLFNL